MTMHLVGPYMTTTNYRKPKQKNLTEKQKQKLELDWKEYNKHMRQCHMHNMQFQKFEDYVAYVRGQYKFKERKPEPFRPMATTSQTYRRETPHIPSLNDGRDMTPCLKKEPKKYTGTLIKGIATMHKSNAVPVISNEQAADIAKMRR